MWSLMKLFRTSSKLCQVCRRQVHFNRHYGLIPDEHQQGRTKLQSYTNSRKNIWLCDKFFSEIGKETNSRTNMLKYSAIYLRRKCTCTLKPCRYREKSVEDGLSFSNGAFLKRKTDNSYRNYSSIHTSASSNSQNRQTHSVRQKPPWRIMFFGTDDIALHTLKNLYNDMNSGGKIVESLEVVTVKEQRAVRVFAESVHLKIHDWPITIETEKYDVGVLVSFGHLIPDPVIHMFPYGILNMHPSLLPRWRGASPVIHTVLNGDKMTGVSVMEIRPKHFDIGPVLLQRKCSVPHRCTSLQLAEILGSFGANLMLECLKDLATLEKSEHEQDKSGVTYAHKLKQKNANIDWESYTAEEIDCQYRAIHELKHLKTEINGQTLKLFDVVDPGLLKDINRDDLRGYHGDFTNAEPGTVVYHKTMKCIVVKCKTGVIGFRNVVFKRKLTALDFFNGYINKNICTKFTSLDNDLNKYIKVNKIPLKIKS